MLDFNNKFLLKKYNNIKVEWNIHWKAILLFIVYQKRHIPKKLPIAKKIHALTISETISFFIIFWVVRLTLLFGHIFIHFSQEMHSPSRNLSSPGLMHTGQFFRQAEHPLRHESLLLRIAENGIIGSIANTAPIGQRNWQKKRFCSAMPIIISIRRMLPMSCSPSGSLNAVSLEKTSQGLWPFRLP